jgi:hypothetical protein
VPNRRCVRIDVNALPMRIDNSTAACGILEG